MHVGLYVHPLIGWTSQNIQYTSQSFLEVDGEANLEGLRKADYLLAAAETNSTQIYAFSLVCMHPN